MTPERLKLETKVLDRYLPNKYKFKDLSTNKPYVLLGTRTNRGNVYTMRVDLDNFPNSIPPAFITKMLKTKNGENMNSPSASMHTLSSEHGYTKICHYGSNAWQPNVSIYKVYLKCRLWLEMYELHLQTGNPIDFYLNHQN